MQLALGDALAVALLETRGFSREDYHLFHPGGRLGAHLKQVATVMHVGDRLPVVPPGTTMAQAIVVQSEKGLGCVIVTDAVGAARRHRDGRRPAPSHGKRGLLAMTVDEVMTPAPTVIAPSTLLGEALEIVESRGISALVVVEASRPVGLVHVLDLLRAGVA